MRYDELPEAGRRLARVPRYGRLLAQLPAEQFHELRNEATTYWRVYHLVADDRERTGLLDDGLKPEEARRLGCHDVREPNLASLETRRWQVRLAGDLIGAVAFELTFGAREGAPAPAAPRHVIDSADELDELLGAVARRLESPRLDTPSQAGAYATITGGPIPIESFILTDWPRLKAMNTLGLSYLLFNSHSAGLRFTDITTQAFFAACWVARWGTEEDRELIHQRIPVHGVGAKEDPNQPYLEFWRLLAELPPECWSRPAQQERWVRAVAPLFRPGDGTADGTRRNCELIYRAWESLETLAAPARRKEEARHAEEAARTKQPVPLGVEGLWPPENILTRRSAVAASPAELAWGTLVAFQAEFAEQCLSGKRGRDPQTVAEKFIAGFQPIPPGEFLMGSPPSEANRRDNERQHRVRMPRAFELHQHPATNEVFRLFLPGHDPNKPQDVPRQPVVRVDWYQSRCFSKWACWNGRSCRLPTEAEWEYACRAGTTTPFHFGSTSDGTQSNVDGNYPYGTQQRGPYLRATSDVGTYPANKFGLHEMHGNVWEWCADWYGEYSEADVVIDPEGARSGSARVLRGGSWYLNAWYSRAACRSWYSPAYRNGGSGFRVARTS